MRASDSSVGMRERGGWLGRLASRGGGGLGGVVSGLSEKDGERHPVCAPPPRRPRVDATSHPWRGWEEKGVGFGGSPTSGETSSFG